jgi:hypothetical protein
LSHQDDIGARCIAGIGGSQCFHFDERVLSDALCIFHDDGELRASGGTLGQEAPKCSKFLHGARCLATDAKAGQQQLQYLVGLQRHTTDRGNHAARRSGFEGAADDRGLANTNRTGDDDDGIDGSQAIIEAFDDFGLLRTDEYGMVFSVFAE